MIKMYTNSLTDYFVYTNALIKSFFHVKNSPRTPQYMTFDPANFRQFHTKKHEK